MKTKLKWYGQVNALTALNVSFSLTITVLISIFLPENLSIFSIVIAAFLVGLIHSLNSKKDMPKMLAFKVSIISIVLIGFVSFLVLHFLVFKGGYSELFGPGNLLLYFAVILGLLIFNIALNYIFIYLGSKTYIIYKHKAGK